ncbi:hypothetical protein [Krasilnikovia sp. M28-CT-15]|uniref:hypothetical protein n=1 Tax=Krasilnikovia sp. M28-CT-15 TaxID=3373540 RepID=UPI003875D93C
MQRTTTPRPLDAATTTARRATRFLLAGQKDYYTPGNAVDAAEYRIVTGYRRR